MHNVASKWLRKSLKKKNNPATFRHLQFFLFHFTKKKKTLATHKNEISNITDVTCEFMQHHQNTEDKSDWLYKGDKCIYTSMCTQNHTQKIHNIWHIYNSFTQRQHDTEHSQTLDFHSEQTGTSFSGMKWTFLFFLNQTLAQV